MVLQNIEYLETLEQYLDRSREVYGNASFYYKPLKSILESSQDLATMINNERAYRNANSDNPNVTRDYYLTQVSSDP